jgi:hypothetical protein
MVEHIDEHDCIKARITERNELTVEVRDADMRLRADQNINALQVYVGALLSDQASEQSIARTNIQHSCVFREERG